MPVIAMRTLFVGKPGPQDVAMLTRLGRRGWGSYSADNLAEAGALIGGGGFDLVLAMQGLSDGCGYELSSRVGEAGGSLFVGIELSNERVWIPVVERGERVFGDRAVRADSAEAELEQLLRASAEEDKDDGTRKNAWQAAPASHDIGYAPIQIQLDPGDGVANPPAPKQSRTAAIARLQLRCASFGLLRAGDGRDEAERSDKASAAGVGRRREGASRIISGMRSHGRSD